MISIDRRRAARWLLAIVPGWLTWHAAVDPAIDPLLRALIVLLAAVAVALPEEALVVVAFAAPIGDLIAIAFDAAPLRLSEAVVVAFFFGWLVSPRRGRPTGPVVHPATAIGAAALVAIVAVSLVVQTIQFTRTAQAAAAQLVPTLRDHYFQPALDPFGLVAAARWVEGVGLAVAVVALVRRSPMLVEWLAGALGAGCVIATGASVLLWFGIGYPDIVERHLLIGYRVVAHLADVNAAGSYFALMTCAAAGLLARDWERRRGLWMVVLSAAVLGLWLSRSRSAEIAVAIAAVPAVWWLVARRSTPVLRYGGLVGLVAVMVVVTLLSSRWISEQSTAYRALFAQTGYRMLHAYPWFGVGVGQFYALSPLFMPPRLAWAYGAENAHNYWMQAAAEIGVVGLGVCLAALVGLALATIRTANASPEPYRVLGLAAAIGAFLVTCSTGHPLLVFDAAYPFWLTIGLLAALTGRDPIAAPQGPDARGHGAAVLAAVAVGLLISLPVRARSPLPGIRSARAIDGLYPWEGPDGDRYRWTEQYASVFVDARSRRVQIPVRMPAAVSSTPADVKFAPIPGAIYPVKAGAAWTTADVDLPMPGPTDRFWRINIMCNRAVPVGSAADGSRQVGVQIGMPRVVDRW